MMETQKVADATSNQSLDSTSSHESYKKKEEQDARKQSLVSNGSQDSIKSGVDDDKWDIFGDDVQIMEEDEEVKNEPMYEAAIVEINPTDTTEEMKEALEMAFKQSRITDRERCILFDKFGLILQALVHSQEKELESIEFLQIKSMIVDMLNNLMDNEIPVGSGASGIDEAVTGEEKHQDYKMQADEEDFASMVPVELEGGRSASTSKDTKDSKEAQLSVDDMDASALRENLLAQKNRLEMQDNMKVIHMLELKQLEFEKTLLEMHYMKMVKPSDIQREMKETRKAVNDLRLEVNSLENAVGQLQLDTHSHEKITTELETVVDSLDLEMLTNQMRTSSSANKPMHLAKEADKLAHKLEQAQDVLGMHTTRWIEGMEHMREYQHKIDAKNDELNMLIREETKMQHIITATQHHRDAFQHELDILTKRERTLLDKCTQAMEQIQGNTRNKKKLHDELHRITNEAARAHRDFQKSERTLKLAHDAHINAKLAYDKMRSAFDITKTSEDSSTWEKLTKMFLREISHLKESLETKLEEAAIRSRNVEELQFKLNELYEDQVSCGKALQNLIRLTVRKRREREEKSEQVVKLNVHLTKVLIDKRVQQMVLNDCAITEHELHRTTALMNKLFNQVKVDRTNLTNDLITGKQKLQEQTEKMKICNNEIDSYNNQLADRETEIKKIHYLNLNASLGMGSIRTKALVAIQRCQHYSARRNEVAMNNKSFRNELQLLKKEAEELTAQFAESGKKASEIATKFRHCLEEACVYTEKIKGYELIILNGTGKLQILEGERAKLASMLEGMTTHNLIVLSNRPCEDIYLEQIKKLRIRFKEVTQERVNLEDESIAIKDANFEHVRELHHDWIESRENPQELHARIESLEFSLATTELKVLERSLAIKQIEQLVQESIEQANFLKANYQEDVKSLVGMRKRIYHMSNLIDGMIAETALATSKSETLEIQYLYLKKKVNSAQRNVLLGLSPTVEIENEWKHYVWQQKWLKRSNEASKKRFLHEKKHLRGAEIIMEKFRPKTSLPPLPTVANYNY